MKKQKDSSGTGGQLLQNLLVRGLLWLMLVLPYRWRVPLSGWIVARVFAPVAGWQKRIPAHLKLAQPNLPEAEVRRMIRAVPDNVGRTLIEIYSGAEFIARASTVPLTGPGVRALEAAFAEARPVILASGHFGNYDAVRGGLIARGYPLGALYRPMKNPWINRHYVRAMGTIGQPLFEQGRRGMAEMLRHLKAGGMLAILHDQHMSKGLPLRFFGVEAKTALSTAEMALKYHALLIPIYAVRQPDGLSFQIVVDFPIPSGTPEAMTQGLNDSLEAIIRRFPEQWLWVHRRWR
jgi:KDO2-lipid IV(A) lauroyltransferase